MKWMLAALGVVMALIGAACVVSGYPIVEVERGWTLTISGAVAMTGGACVLAIGLALARVEGLFAHLARLQGGVADEAQAAPAQAAPAQAAPAQAAPARPPLRPAPPPRFGESPQAFENRPLAASAEAEEIVPHPTPSPAPPPAPPPPFARPSVAPGPQPEALAEEAPAPGNVEQADKPQSGLGAPIMRLQTRRAPDFLTAARREQAGDAAALAAVESALAVSESPELAPEAPYVHEERRPEPIEGEAGAPVVEPAAEALSPSEPPYEAQQLQPVAPAALEEAAGPAEPSPPTFRRFPIRSLTLPRGVWPESPFAGAEPVPPPPLPALPSETESAQAESADVPVLAPPPQNSESAPAASTEDWFERALAGLDEISGASSASSGSVEAAEAPEPAGEAPSEQSPQEPERLEEAQAPPPEGEESGEPAAADEAGVAASAGEPPIEIGRYETEGTLYVMYADGSIEAQTPSGVYRFASLAALKEHIESVA